MFDINNLPDDLETYRIRSTVRAKRVDGDDVVSTPFGAIPITAGDYVVVTEDGKVAPVPAAEFERLFEPVSEDAQSWEDVAPREDSSAGEPTTVPGVDSNLTGTE